jgi:hypothetical protein
MSKVLIFIISVIVTVIITGCGAPKKEVGTVITTLPDMLCRFLTMGDVDSDGKNEIVAAPLKSGVWLIDYENGIWSKKLIDDNSSGFEHAALIADLEGDGTNEIYVAADDQGVLNRYRWNGSSFDKEELVPIEKDIITFGVMPGRIGVSRQEGSSKTVMPDLVLTQAQFHEEKGEDGKMKSIPGAARMVLVYETKSGWMSEVVEDSESNVFHKAIPYPGPGGEPGLLTIGANAAILKHWVKKGGKWQATTLYRNEFGGEQNRLRDFEIGDVTGDGQDNLVIATHDQGIVLVLSGSGYNWTAQEIDRKPNTFVHEIELGDIDDDGVMEIFATPSEPNKLDGTVQPGLILMYNYNGQKFVRSIVEEFPTRHVKEILCGDIDMNGQPELYSAVEADLSKLKSGEATVEIKQYTFGERP